jgi:high-affinity Fe2+/Pb2+ permease
MTPTTSTTPLTRGIMAAVLAWGLLLALGTYLVGGNHPALRAAIVAGCTFGFLGLWLAALALRWRRLDDRPR